MAASGTNKEIKNEALLGLLSSNIISGLTLSNDATDASNDLDIAVGVATVTDGTAWYVAKLASALVKQLDAAWAVGTNAGGLDTGAEASATWYHVWLIQRSDTGVVDVLFSTSATAPTMPTNYDRKRRIGAIYNNASSIIDQFVQVGDQFLWTVVKTMAKATNPGTSAVLRAFQVPLGVKVLARLNATVYDSAAATAHTLRVSSPDQTDETVAVGRGQLSYFTSFGAARNYAALGDIRTDTSSQVRTRVSGSSATTELDMGCEGWIDTRGRT